MKTSSKILKDFIESDHLIEEHNVIGIDEYHEVMKELGYTFRSQECIPNLTSINYVGFYEIKATFVFATATLILEKI